MADGLSALCQHPAFSSLLLLPAPPSSSSLSLNALPSSCQALSISSPNYISNRPLFSLSTATIPNKSLPSITCNSLLHLPPYNPFSPWQPGPSFQDINQPMSLPGLNSLIASYCIKKKLPTPQYSLGDPRDQLLPGLRLWTHTLMLHEATGTREL